jgi:hypothetical protein
MVTDPATRQALLNIIEQGRAHMSFEQIIEGFPPDHYNTHATNVPYSFWGLLEHVRICLDLTLDYAFAKSFAPKAWPQEFWPSDDALADVEIWNDTVGAIRAAVAELRRVVADESIDLNALCRNASDRPEHTILFEIIDAIDHNAWHFGEFAILRQVMGLWPAGRE